MTLDASFWSRALATLIGTVAGFIFSIALFYLSEHIKRSRDRAKIIKGLMREATFNISLCDSWLAAFGNIRSRVALGDKAFYNYLDYTRLQRVFLHEAAMVGLLYDLLTDVELSQLDKALRFANDVAEKDINGALKSWKDDVVPTLNLSTTLGFHEYVVKEMRSALDRLREQSTAAL